MKKEWPKYTAKRKNKKIISESGKVFEKLSKKDQEIMNDFLTYCSIISNNSEPNRNDKTILIKIADFIEKPLDKLVLEDVMAITYVINNSEVTRNSKNDIKAVLKRFLKWKYEDWEKRFKKLEFVKQKTNNDEDKLSPEELITDEDLDKLFRACDNIKHKTLIALMYESAGRPEEILKLKWKDIDFEKAQVHLFSAKTGKKRVVYLDNSIGHLKKWFKECSNPEDDHFIFCKRNKNEKFSKAYLSLVIKNISKKAQMEKRVWPYLFRHTRLSHLIRKLSTPVYEMVSGHSYQMGLKTYAHPSEENAKKEMNEKIFEIVELPEKKKHKLEIEVDKMKQEMKHLKYLILKAPEEQMESYIISNSSKTEKLEGPYTKEELFKLYPK